MAGTKRCKPLFIYIVTLPIPTKTVFLKADKKQTHKRYRDRTRDNRKRDTKARINNELKVLFSQASM